MNHCFFRDSVIHLSDSFCGQRTAISYVGCSHYYNSHICVILWISIYHFQHYDIQYCNVNNSCCLGKVPFVRGVLKGKSTDGLSDKVTDTLQRQIEFHPLPVKTTKLHSRDSNYRTNSKTQLHPPSLMYLFWNALHCLSFIWLMHLKHMRPGRLNAWHGMCVQSQSWRGEWMEEERGRDTSRGGWMEEERGRETPQGEDGWRSRCEAKHPQRWMEGGG